MFKFSKTYSLLLVASVVIGALFGAHSTAHAQSISSETPTPTNVQAMLADNVFQKELADAAYSHVSDSILVTIKRHVTEKNQVYLVSHIVINDPSQVTGGLSNDTFGGSRENPTTACKRTGAILLTNGSYFSYKSGEPVCYGICIKNGEVKKDGKTNGNEICLTNTGLLFTPAKGLTSDELLLAGVTQVFGTADPLLIQDSVKIPQSQKKTYPRTAIGMKRPCEYYIITAAEGNYNNGVSFTQLQDLFYDLGCVYARSLDGGGSASLVLNGTLINKPAAGAERPVTDFLYFTEYVEPEIPVEEATEIN